MIRYAVDGEVDSNEIASLVEEATGRTVSVTTNESLDGDGYQMTVSFAGNDSVSLEEQQQIAQELSDAYADRTFSVVESSSVDPTMGARFFQKCIVCMAITFVILLVYIALRFRKIGGLSAGVTAIIALLHDVLIVFFAFVIFGFSINDVFIAVVLTILGYSLNDTIVIYDRIRENRRLEPTKSVTALPGIVNKSLNQTMTRSILTSLTTSCAARHLHRRRDLRPDDRGNLRVADDGRCRGRLLFVDLHRRAAVHRLDGAQSRQEDGQEIRITVSSTPEVLYAALRVFFYLERPRAALRGAGTKTGAVHPDGACRKYLR